MQPLLDLQLLILLTLANGTPVIAKKVFGDRLAWPLDGGLGFIDGRPLLGRSKTLRGIVLAVLAAGARGAPLGPRRGVGGGGGRAAGGRGPAARLGKAGAGPRPRRPGAP